MKYFVLVLSVALILAFGLGILPLPSPYFSAFLDGFAAGVALVILIDWATR